MIPVITDEHQEAMKSHGYTIFADVFSPEDLTGVLEALDGFESQKQAALAKRAEGDGSISRANEITFNDHLAEQNEAVRKFGTRPEFVALTTAFLGPDTDLYYNQSVFKYPEGEREFPWHQDDAYTPVEPAPYLTLWLALNDATIENGCVSVLPGSHLGGLRPHVQSPIGLVGYENDNPDQGIHVPIEAGSIACFWSLTLHKSGPNRSNGIRKAFVIQYTQTGTKVIETGEVIPNLIPVARNGVAI